MSLPAELTFITVTGTIADVPTGAERSVRFTCPWWLTGSSDDIVCPPFTVSAVVAADGSFSVQLPATDDPDWTPIDWTYAVTIKADVHVLSASLAVPYDGGTIDIADTINPEQAATSGQVYALASSVSNVNNTSDANKPVSTATQTALNAKMAITGGQGFTLSNGGQVVQGTANRMDMGFSAAAAGAGVELYRADHATRPGEIVYLFGGEPDAGVVTFMHYDGGDNYLLRAQLLPAGGVAIYNGEVPVTLGDGGVLYVENGALKYKGSNGTITPLANA